MPTAVAKTQRRPPPQAAALQTVDTPVTASLAAPFAWPVEQWLGFQAALFKLSEPFWMGWIERRSAAAHALLDNVGKLARCDDPGAVAAIHSEWLGGAMERLEAEARALSEHATAASRFVSGAVEAVARLPWGDTATATGPAYAGPERRSPSRPWSDLATD